VGLADKAAFDAYLTPLGEIDWVVCGCDGGDTWTELSVQAGSSRSFTAESPPARGGFCVTQQAAIVIRHQRLGFVDADGLPVDLLDSALARTSPRLGQDPANGSKKGKAASDLSPRVRQGSSTTRQATLMSGHRFEPLAVSTHNMQENQMRELLVSTVVALASVVPALAQDAPAQAADPSAVHDQQDVVNQSVQSFEQRVQQRLTQAGFTNIEMVPTSILIRAIDRDGNPVMLALSPDSLSEWLQVSGGQNYGSGSDTPSRHPAVAAPRHPVSVRDAHRQPAGAAQLHAHRQPAGAAQLHAHSAQREREVLHHQHAKSAHRLVDVGFIGDRGQDHHLQYRFRRGQQADAQHQPRQHQFQ
jgi:hypothetical protein